MRALIHSMKRLAFSLITAAAVLASLNNVNAGGFDSAPGLQVYSLRSQIKLRGLPWALDQIKAMGITELELAGLPPELTAETLKTELDKRGLKPVSSHFPYERYRDDLASVVKEAKSLGLQYAGCAWIRHEGDFDVPQCDAAIEVFNKAGEALAKEGIKFFYHIHGFEFQKTADGTLVDKLIKGTTPGKVNYEMDVLWIVFPGQDPVKLMQAYPDRWVLMHLKDLKKGVETGALTGHTDVNNNVVLGQGQVNWPAVFAEAQKIGIKHYFIEDESDSVMDQMAGHINYFRTVKW